MLEGVCTSLCLVLSLLAGLPLWLLALGPFLLNLDLAFDFDFSLGLGLSGLESDWGVVVLEFVAELQFGCALVNVKDDLEVASELTSSDGVLEFIALGDIEGRFLALGEALRGFGRLANG